MRARNLLRQKNAGEVTAREAQIRVAVSWIGSCCAHVRWGAYTYVSWINEIIKSLAGSDVRRSRAECGDLGVVSLELAILARACDWSGGLVDGVHSQRGALVGLVGIGEGAVLHRALSRRAERWGRRSRNSDRMRWLVLSSA